MHKNGEVNLYNTNNVAIRIKNMLSIKKISASKMLLDLGLGVNALYQFEQGRVMSSFNLAKIADYLDCSVDYLLGRTDRIQMAPDPLHVAYNNASDDVKSAVRKLLDIKQADD